MFPKHCREVSLRKVSFPLNRDEITKRFVGKMAYTSTNYIILNNGCDWAITKIEKLDGPELFKEIKKVEIISLPKNTWYVEDPNVDVLNPSAMVKIVEREGKETLVVKGKFEHTSFVRNEKPIRLKVFDVVPPYPSKLIELVEKALGIGRIEKPTKIVLDTIDLNALAQTSNTPFTMFPCYTPGLKCEKNVLFLEQAPDISSIGAKKITLIGCDLSLRIFTSLYEKNPVFINMCPKKNIEKESANNLGITRCCAINEGYERVRNIAYVPWGARVNEVEEAVLDLLLCQ